MKKVTSISKTFAQRHMDMVARRRNTAIITDSSLQERHPLFLKVTPNLAVNTDASLKTGGAPVTLNIGPFWSLWNE